MAEAKKTGAFAVPATKVWSTIRDFGGLGKVMKGVEVTAKGEGVGTERTIATPGGAEVVERLESIDDDAMRLEYSIVSGPLPLRDYLSTMQVRDAGDGRCEVDWSATFEPAGVDEAQAVALVDGIYTQGIEGFRRAFED